MKLVVGLGNPGKKYERTRHNLGFVVVELVAERRGARLRSRRCDSLVGEAVFDGERVLLAKPQTYMNRSGAAVRALLKECGATPQDLIVVYDDLDLPFGRIRIRPGGSAGGHRGVQSILDELAGASFYRVRLGIGRPPEGVDPTDYVLEPFTPEEASRLGEFAGRAADAVACLLLEGPERAMGQFNRAG
ncbi:MAG TPA: aminoacyl-tRNA hydrolase [candidate division Zixibacteria bacterium]|nr:aminoacyl-tRNA hydrolase [candidate division Zixibacteria bacterium]